MGNRPPIETETLASLHAAAEDCPVQLWYCSHFSNKKIEAELQDFAPNHKADLFLKESRDKHLPGCQDTPSAHESH